MKLREARRPRRGVAILATSALIAAVVQVLGASPASALTTIVSQNFDGVTAPALPSGWTTTKGITDKPWVTTTSTPDSAPNAAFAPANLLFSDIDLYTPAFTATKYDVLTFRQKYGFYLNQDGGVLEIKIANGEWTDFVAAGGVFGTGGYNDTLAGSGTGTGVSNVLNDRAAWTGTSSSYTTTTAYLPASTVGKSVQLRWRLGTDNLTTTPSTGWWIDGVTLTTDVQATVTVNQASGQADPTAATTANFAVVFNRAVTGFTASDVSFTGSTAPGTLKATVTGSGTTYAVAVTGMTGSGTIKPSLAADVVNGGNTASTSTDNTVTYVPATVTVNQATGQTDPATAGPINFTAKFSKSVTGLTAAGVLLSASKAPGKLVATVTGSGTTYTIAVSGMTGAGAVTASIALNAVSGGNAASTSTDNSVNYVPATVTINQDSAQADPATLSGIKYDVVFNHSVTGFTASDVTFTGSSAPGALAAAVSGSGASYTVVVTGMTGSGTVKPALAANVVTGGNTASTSTDNTVTYTPAATVTVNQASTQADPAAGSPVKFTVVFSKAVTGLASSDFLLKGTTATGAKATVSGSGATYTVSVAGMTSPGLIIVSLTADKVTGGNAVSTSTDNKVDYEPATVTINQTFGEDDPTTRFYVSFDVSFNRSVTGFSPASVSLAGSTAPGNLTVQEVGDGANYEVSVEGMTGPGIIKASILPNSINGGNLASTSTDNSVTYSATSVTINQATTQADPTITSPIAFTIVFGQPVTGLTAADIGAYGTAFGNDSPVIVLTGSGTTYTATVSGMDYAGHVSVGLETNVVDQGNALPTSTDDDVTFNHSIVEIDQASGQTDPTSLSPIDFLVFFDQAVTGFTASDISFAGSTAPGKLVATLVSDGGDVTVDDVVVTGMTGPGVVKVSIPENAVDQGNFPSTTVDNSVTYTGTNVVVSKASGQADPAATQPFKYTVVFGKAVTGFTAADVDLASSSTPGKLVATVTGSGTTYAVSITGATGAGSVILHVDANAVNEGNGPSTSADQTIAYVPASVTINQAASQADPAATGPILFTVVFSKAVTGFTAAGVGFSGSTAKGTLVATVTGSGANYTVSVTGMTTTGVVKASIPLNKVTGGNTASTSTDNSVTYTG